MEGLNYTEKFLRAGHTIGPSIRDEQGRIVCDRCGVAMSTDEADLVCPKADYVHVAVMNREIKLIMDNFGGIKSGKKIQKKVAKLYQKEMSKFAQEKTEELYKSFEEHIKPRPKWMPEKVWRWIGSKFIEGL